MDKKTIKNQGRTSNVNSVKKGSNGYIHDNLNDRNIKGQVPKNIKTPKIPKSVEKAIRNGTMNRDNYGKNVPKEQVKKQRDNNLRENYEKRSSSNIVSSKANYEKRNSSNIPSNKANYEKRNSSNIPSSKANYEKTNLNNTVGNKTKYESDLRNSSSGMDFPKIPKSVEKAIKKNEGRKVSQTSINNVDKNPNKKNLENKKNNKKVNIKRKKYVLIITFLVAILVCISILLLKLPYFNISDVEIVGTNKYTKDEILQKSNIVLGENIFIQIFKSNKKNITTLPYVDDTSIVLNLPNKITIKVKERIPKYFAYDSENESFYKLSKDGYILEKTDINSKGEDELLITGIPFYDTNVIGEKIDDIYMNKILVYELIQTEYDKNNFLGKVTKVNFANSLTTLTINDKLNVIFPNDTELEYKMKVLRKILNELGEDAVGKIDMTKTNPTFSSF